MENGVEQVRLAVRDDGPGFQPCNVETWLREGHLGLVGMVERAKLAGGLLSVESTPGGGTVTSDY